MTPRNNGIADCINAAHDMDVELGWALSKRRQWVLSSLEEKKDEKKKLEYKYDTAYGDHVDAILKRKLLYNQINKMCDEIAIYERELTESSSFANTLTIDMIDKARRFPYYKALRLKEDNMMIKCPFHEEKNPSFLVRNGFGFCFGCGAKEDSIGAIMRLCRTSFQNAVRGLISGLYH